MYEYKAIITRVVDGDTFDAEVDVGFSITIKHRFRLTEIDTPETWRPKSNAEAEHGAKCTSFVKQLMEMKQVLIKSNKLGIYGRYEASVTLPDGQNLATLLIENGFEKLDSYPEDSDDKI